MEADKIVTKSKSSSKAENARIRFVNDFKGDENVPLYKDTAQQCSAKYKLTVYDPPPKHLHTLSTFTKMPATFVYILLGIVPCVHGYFSLTDCSKIHLFIYLFIYLFI